MNPTQPFSITDPNRIINQTTGQTALSAQNNFNKISTPTSPVTIDVGTLGTSPNLNIKPATPVPVPDISTLGVTAQTTPQVATPAPAPTAPQGGVAQRLLDSISGISRRITGKEATTAEAVQQATSPYETQLSDINAQIKMHQARALQRQEEAISRTGATTTTASIAAQQIARTDAIEAMKLSAIADGLRGDIASAEKKATNAVNEQFAKQEQELATAKQQIYDNYDSFSPAEKKRADATLLRLDSKDTFVQTQKEDEKNKMAFVAEAARNRAPAVILNQMSRASSPMEAVAIGAKYMSDPNKAAQDLADLEYKRAQTSKIYEDMALSKEELKLKRQQQAQNVVIDPTTGKPTSELMIEAKTSAKDLFDKFVNKQGVQIVGKSRLFTAGKAIPGTKSADFEVQFNNLKSLISLENVKYLKGQGQITENERKLLADASSKLNLSQSDDEFRKTLVRTSIGLGNPQEVTLTDKNGVSKPVVVDAETLDAALRDGLSVTY